MMILKIWAYMLMVTAGIIGFIMFIVGILMCYAMVISEDNCKGCYGYPNSCRKCRVYKNMDKETKETWIDSKK
jgi:hypothetical protein